MIEVMLFGGETREKCGRILKKYIPGQLAEGMNKKKLPLKLLSQISRQDEFVLLHRSMPEEYWCVLGTEQSAVLRMAQRNYLRTLTCGFSSYDTLVLSSMSAEQAVVSLQREIQTAVNELLEPGDYVIHHSPNGSEKTILLCTATLLLSGKANGEHIFYF